MATKAELQKKFKEVNTTKAKELAEKLKEVSTKETKNLKLEKPKKVKEEKVKPTPKEEKVKKEVTQRNKDSLVEQVISNREVKYKYPEDVVDTLSRKSWRQKIRNELRRLELSMARIKDQDSKEYKSAKKKYDAFRKETIKEVG